MKHWHFYMFPLSCWLVGWLNSFNIWLALNVGLDSKNVLTGLSWLAFCFPVVLHTNRYKSEIRQQFTTIRHLTISMHALQLQSLFKAFVLAATILVIGLLAIKNATAVENSWTNNDDYGNDNYFYVDDYSKTNVLNWSSDVLQQCKNYWRQNDCQHLLFQNRGDQHSWPSFLQNKNQLLDLKNVLLIVTFNNPFYESSEKVHAMYNSIFKDIIECHPEDGESSQEFVVHYGKQKKINGETFYFCTTMVKKWLESRKLKVSAYSGYLFISDDVLLNVWMLKTLGKNLQSNWIMGDNDDHIFDIDNVCL